MIDSELLSILCCPETKQGLEFATPALIEKINRQISSGNLRNRAGQPVMEKLEAGLIRLDRRMIYPVRLGIPILLVDEAFTLDSSDVSSATS